MHGHSILAGVCTGVWADDEMTRIMQSLWNSDVNRLTVGTDLVINLQSYTRGSDQASNR